MVRWHATRGVSVINFVRSVVMINGILHLPQLSAMPALTEYGRRLEAPHPRGQVVQVSRRTILHHVLRQSLGTLYLTAREDLSFSLSLSCYLWFIPSVFV